MATEVAPPKAGRATRERAAAALAAALVALSAVDLPTWLDLPRPLSTIAAFLVVPALVALLARHLLTLARRHPVLVLAAVALLATDLAGLSVSAEPLRVLRFAAKDAVALLLGAALLAHPAKGSLRRVVAWAAAAVLVACLAGFLLGLVHDGVRAELFESLAHERVSLPRFRGLMHTPSRFGRVALACAGLAQGLPDRRARHGLGGLGVGLAVATMSFPSLVALVIPVWALLRWSRARRAVGVLIVATSLLVLWVHALEVRASGETLHAVSEAVLARDEGLRSWDMSVGPLRARLRTSAYFEIDAAAIACAAAHPALGVGAGSFPIACPVLAVDTLGYSGPHQVHGELPGLLAERGIAGLCAFVFLFLVLRRRYALGPDRIQTGAVVAHVACGLALIVSHIPLLVMLVTMSLIDRAESTGRPAQPVP